MTPTSSLDRYPTGRPLTADQVTEFHAARIILLVFLCGTKDRTSGQFQIAGLTKMAKLDFFVRYPDFFERAKESLAQRTATVSLGPVESSMVRFHYGPWDPRYYQILAYLESRELLGVKKLGRAFVFSLTSAGVDVARRLAKQEPYKEITLRMTNVKTVFGNKTGDWLKKLVYKLFDEEVSRLPLGMVIES
jgi:hypothetical protein